MSHYVSTSVAARQLGVSRGAVQKWCRTRGFGIQATPKGHWFVPLENLTGQNLAEFCAKRAPDLGKIRHIQEEVARAWGITMEALLGHQRTNYLVVPRHVAIFIAGRMTGHSLPVIGKLFYRDHTTILHAQRKMRARYESDPKFRELIDSLENQLRGRDE